MGQTDYRTNAESIVGIVIVCAILASLFGIYTLPLNKLDAWLNADLQTAYAMLAEIGLFDSLRDIVGLEGVSQQFQAWQTQIRQEALAVAEGPTGDLEVRLLNIQLQFVRSLGYVVLLMVVRTMVVLGAVVLFAPAIACTVFLALRARDIRSSGFAEHLTPFMQGIQMRLLWFVLVAAVFCSLTPIVPIQFAVILVALWIGGAGFVAAHIQKI